MIIDPELLAALTKQLTESLTESLTKSLTESLTKSLTIKITAEVEAKFQPRITSLETENTQLKERITSLETENTQLKERITSLETENTRLKERITSLETENTQLKTENTQLKDRITLLEARVKFLETENTQLNMTNKKLNESIRIQDNNLHNLSKIHEQLQREIVESDSETRISKLEKHVKILVSIAQDWERDCTKRCALDFLRDFIGGLFDNRYVDLNATPSLIRIKLQEKRKNDYDGFYDRGSPEGPRASTLLTAKSACTKQVDPINNVFHQPILPYMDEAMEEMATGVKSEIMKQANMCNNEDQKRSLKRIFNNINVANAKENFKRAKHCDAQESRVAKVFADITNQPNTTASAPRKLPSTPTRTPAKNHQTPSKSRKTPRGGSSTPRTPQQTPQTPHQPGSGSRSGNRSGSENQLKSGSRLSPYAPAWEP
jgi:predicted nuclease with TOPRIM domain